MDTDICSEYIPSILKSSLILYLEYIVYCYIIYCESKLMIMLKHEYTLLSELINIKPAY